ncbi:MAG: ATPase [Gammaproteobacteria bacterium]|nr:ATPase [Gammaproteobacteria bacterium]
MHAIRFSNTAPGTTHVADDISRTWKPLGFLNIYRFILSAVFTVLLLTRDKPLYIGAFHPTFALWTTALYLAFSAACGFFIARRWPRFELQTYVQISVDILAITLLMYASGGAGSGVGMLLVVAIASGGIIMTGRTANFIAALATVTTLTVEVFADLTRTFAPSYPQAGLLGATFFATAFLAYVLASRARASEELAAQRGIDLANLAQLNEHVIQRMQSGIVVVDADLRVRLMNESAWFMLGMPVMNNNVTLRQLSSPLAEQLRHWRDNNALAPQVFRASDTHNNLLPRFTRVGSPKTSGTLIFLEDSTLLAQQAQQMKLASLGRLTASIAHEVRNPLGAISHAGQLLSESPQLNAGDKRLTEIIQTQSRRMNAIIENVLQLSRRDRSNPQPLALNPWLTNFAAEFAAEHHVDASSVSVDITPPGIVIHVDHSQLQQVLTNLCDNGLRHSGDYAGLPKIELHGGITRESGGPFLDVVDHGPGIPPDIALNIFEPFFTTEATGTGLGLYIARELCEINRARLNYLPIPSGGSCFRINFSDFERS